jgi:hypothetical protein
MNWFLDPWTAVFTDGPMTGGQYLALGAESGLCVVVAGVLLVAVSAYRDGLKGIPVRAPDIRDDLFLVTGATVVSVMFGPMVILLVPIVAVLYAAGYLTWRASTATFGWVNRRGMARRVPPAVEVKPLTVSLDRTVELDDRLTDEDRAWLRPHVALSRGQEPDASTGTEKVCRAGDLRRGDVILPCRLTAFDTARVDLVVQKRPSVGVVDVHYTVGTRPGTRRFKVFTHAEFRVNADNWYRVRCQSAHDGETP